MPNWIVEFESVLDPSSLATAATFCIELTAKLLAPVSVARPGSCPNGANDIAPTPGNVAAANLTVYGVAESVPAPARAAVGSACLVALDANELTPPNVAPTA